MIIVLSFHNDCNVFANNKLFLLFFFFFVFSLKALLFSVNELFRITLLLEAQYLQSSRIISHTFSCNPLSADLYFFCRNLTVFYCLTRVSFEPTDFTTIIKSELHLRFMRFYHACASYGEFGYRTNGYMYVRTYIHIYSLMLFT